MITREDIQRVRKFHAITQQQLADRMGYHVNHIRHIEQGTRAITRHFEQHFLTIFPLVTRP